MKKLIVSLSLFLFCLPTMAQAQCDKAAEKAAITIMNLNGINPVMAELNKKEHVDDGVNTNYYIYQFVPLDSNGVLLDLGYEVSIEAVSCRLIAFELKGLN